MTEKEIIVIGVAKHGCFLATHYNMSKAKAIRIQEKGFNEAQIAAQVLWAGTPKQLEGVFQLVYNLAEASLLMEDEELRESRKKMILAAQKLV